MIERSPLVEDIENYAQNIVDTVREPLLILDTTLRVRSANRAFYQTFHVSPVETEGRLIYELGNGQWDIPDLRTLLEDIVPKSSVFDDFELEHTFPIIGRRVMLLNARKLQAGHHGELLVLAMEDVTARKRAEEALLEAGALQSAIFNSANFSSIATDEKGVIQIFNVGAERMLGYAAAEVMNKITPADISDPQEVITRAKALSAELGTTITPGFEALVFKAARGIEDIYELTYIRKDGSRFPAVVSVTALRDAQGGIIGYLLIGTDNTARKQVEAERMLLDQRVRDQQFYTRSLIESNIDALITTDPRGIITDVNKQMEALTGCTRDELIGAPFKNYFTNPERAEAGIKLVLGENKLTNYELTARSRDGKETVVSYNATTFHDRDRKLQGVFAAARDVTERKRYEQSLQQANSRMSRDLKAAAKIQATFLPREIPHVPGTDFAWIYRPCDELAGDGLNIIPLGDGKIGLYVLDVSGHGVASALLSVTMSRLLSPPSEPSSILIREGVVADRFDITPPAEVAARLNHLFPFDSATEQLTTLVYGILNGATGEFRYISAGHPGPVHLPSGSDPVILESQGFPIGLGNDAYEERSVRLSAGDRLYLYSDGVPEGMNPAGQQFGNARLVRAIGQGRSEPLRESVANLLDEILRWHGSGKPHDDISILAVEVSVPTGVGEPGVESIIRPHATERKQ